MAKRGQAPNKTVYLAIIVILTLAVIGSVYLYIQKSNAYSQEANAYSSLNSNYTTAKVQISNLESQVSTLQTQLSSNKTLLLNVSKKYNATEYNLTHPYTKALFTKKVIAVPAETYNYTLTAYQAGISNFSISVPYPGYITLNYTVAPVKQATNASTFYIYISNEQPYYFQGELVFNEYVKPYTSFAGQPTSKLIIPIMNGTTYFLLYNFENQSATMEFSMNYVGFHTS
ncbi:MAG: hypothetical protein QXH69_00400 [Candidatus Micrarchaeaceae archaeon]